MTFLNNTFNKAEFAQLLERAKGDRSINQYATDTDVSAAHISRFLREMIVTPPAPETLSKLASKAYNEVTYRDFMVAAGHIVAPYNAGDERIVDPDSPQYRRHQMEEMERRFIQIILADLYTKPFKWSVEQPEGRMMVPDMVLNIDDGRYTRWYFEFKMSTGRSAMMPFPLLQRAYYMIATMPLERTDKFTIAVNDEQAFDLFFKKPPLSIRANVYVMLVDLEGGKVVKEEKLCEY